MEETNMVLLGDALIRRASCLVNKCGFNMVKLN